MTKDFHQVRNIAANAPYDQIYILVNTEKYGGGAIYNFYSMINLKKKPHVLNSYLYLYLNF